jgi:uncharacterized protein
MSKQPYPPRPRRFRPSRHSGSIPSPRRLPWRRLLRYVYLRFLRLRGSPREIARGLAVGVFAGWFPLFGLQIILSVALAALVRGNKLVAAASTWVSNPLTYIPIYLFNFRVGQWLLRSQDWQFSRETLLSLRTIRELGNEFILVLFTGSLVMGLAVAVTSYGLGLWLTRYLRRRHWGDRFKSTPGDGSALIQNRSSICKKQHRPQPAKPTDQDSET